MQENHHLVNNVFIGDGRGRILPTGQFKIIKT
jgi:hypothetical protein